MMSNVRRLRHISGRRALVLCVGVASIILVTRVSTTGLEAVAATPPRIQISSPMQPSYPMPAGWTERLDARIQSDTTMPAMVIFAVMDLQAKSQVLWQTEYANLVAGHSKDVTYDWTLPKNLPAGTYTLQVGVLSMDANMLAANANAFTFQTAPPVGTTVAPSPVTATNPPSNSGTAGKPTPQAGQPCPTWVHDQYVTTGPDGKTYATWHPPVEPQYGCYFGHEHGADPRTSRANSTLPAFGYAAAQMGMVEPHEGYKVFVMNAGDPVDSNTPNKVSDEDVRIVFHMGTSGIGRFTQEFHSMQYDIVDYRTGESAHVNGMGDTGPTERDGATCDYPRKGAKDFSTLGCADTYEIWDAVRFQILDPHDPFTGLTESRFATIPSIAVFDPITSRDPSNNGHLLYTQAIKPNPANLFGVDPTSPQAYFLGCRREFYSGPVFWNNANRPTVYWTDALGRVSANNQLDAAHPIRQEISASSGTTPVIYKDRRDYCGDGIHTPN